MASRDSGSDAPFERIAEASHGEESFGNARGPRTSGAPTTRRPLAGMGGQHGEGQRRRDDIRRFSPLGELSGTAPTVNRKRSGNFVTMYSVSDLVEPGPASYHREMVQSGVSKRRHSRRAAAASMAGVMVLNIGIPAWASHNYDGLVPTANYSPGCFSVSPPFNSLVSVCQTDNADLYWYADSNDPGELETNDFNAVSSVLSTQYAPTDLVIHYDPTPVFSGSGERDLILQEAEDALPMPSQALGITWCNGAASAWHECDQTYVRIDGPDYFRKYGGSITCHEIGHAVGLVHGNNASPALDPGDARLGCMVNEDEFPPSLGSASAHLIDTHY